MMEAMISKHDKFGWNQMNAGIRKMIREDWLAALQVFPLEEVRQACRMHTQEEPNKVPNEGHIKSLILRERAKVVRSQPKPVELEQRRSKLTDEQRAEADEMIKQFAQRAKGWSKISR